MRFDRWLRTLTANRTPETAKRRSRRRWLALETLEDRCVPAMTVSVLPVSPLEGAMFNGVVANVSDPGNNEPSTDYSALINWGDGSAGSPGTISGPTGGPFTVSGSHTYATDGQYALSVTVSNNAAAGTWTVEAPMPTASMYLAAAAGANGLLYVFGGQGNGPILNNGSILNTVQAYNPATNTWATEAPMPTASAGLAAAAGANGLLYVFGGFNGSILNTVQAYNPATNTWATEAPMPTAGMYLAAAAGANGLLYVFGGDTGSSALNTVQAYNPATNTWATEAPMPTASAGLAAAAGANGLLYVFGGFNGSILNTVQAYNPATNTWTTEAPMPTASASLAAAAGANGLLYVFGGDTGSSALNTVQAYNPATNTWTTEAPMPTASTYLAAAAGANGPLYVFGGYTGSSTLNTVQAYNPGGASGSGSRSISIPTQPMLDFLSLTQAAPGTSLTITGTGFSTTASEDAVTIGKVSVPVISASTTDLEVIVPAGGGAGLPVQVTVAGQKSSNTINFSYAPPALTSLSSPVAAPNTALTIVGSGFSATATDDLVTFGAASATVTSASTTQLVVTVPAGVGTNVSIQVAYDGQTSNSLPFSYAPPKLTLVSPTVAGPGTTLDITGTGFSTIASDDLVTIGKLVAPITLASATELEVTVPAGGGAGLPVQVTVAGQASTNTINFSYTPPKLTSLSSPVAAPNTSLTILGSGFSATATDDVVTFGSVSATVTSASTTQLVVTVPAGVGIGVSVQVAYDGQTSNTLPFSYAPPKLTLVSPTVAGPGTTLDITGTGFSTTGSDDVVTIGKLVAPITSASATELEVTVPAGGGAGLPVQVTVAGQASTNTINFSYAPPALTSLSSPVAAPNTALTIVGSGFSATATDDLVTFGAASATVTSASTTQLVVTVPAGAGTNVSIQVAYDGQTSNTLPFNYTPPKLTSVSPTVAGPGTTLVITGTGFSTIASDDVVTIGKLVAPITSASATELEVTVPAGGGEGLPVQVTVTGQASTNTINFSYAPPALTSLSSPVAAPNTSLTIVGSGFSATATDDVVTFGSVSATVTSASTTQLVVTVPAGAGTGVSVQVAYDGQSSNSLLFNYLPTVNVSDAGGTFSGSTFPATATVTGFGGTAGSTLEGVALTLTYYLGSNATGTLLSGAPAAAGNYTVVASFPGSTDYASTSAQTSFTISPAMLTISWASPSTILYGTPLSATQLDATANVPGTFTYTPAVGSILGVGSYTLNVAFTPIDTTDYLSTTATVPLTVAVAPVPVNWAPPASIPYGTMLSATQLDAAADVPGTFAYTPPAGTILNAGPQTLSTTFTPTDAVDYNAPSVTVPLTVTQATPTIGVSDPGGTFNNAAFPATATVAGVSGTPGSSLEGVSPTLTYYSGNQATGTPLAGVPTAAGTYTVLASFAGSSDYTSGSAQATFTISPAPTSTTLTSSATPIMPGQSVTFTATVSDGLSAPLTPAGMVQFQIDGQNAGPAVALSANDTASYSTAALAPGSHLVTAQYAGYGDFAASTSTPFAEVVLGSGVTLVGSELILIGADTNDQVQITPVGSSNTGSTGVKVKATLNGVTTTTTYNQALSSVVIDGYGGNDSIQLANNLTIAAVITEGDGNDSIQGGNGNDTVTAGNGTNIIQMGDGNDTVTVGDGNDTVTVGDGNDTLTAGNGTDSIQTGNGNSSVVVGKGNDVVQLGKGDNTVAGGDGNDTVQGGNGANAVHLGKGADVLNLGNGTNTVTLGDGNDYVQLGKGNNIVTAGNGTDNIQAGNGDDTVTLGDGNDTVTLGNGTDNIQAGNGNNSVTTGSGNSIVRLGDGNNVVVTGNGTNSIQVGNGDNLVAAGRGQHTVQAGNGSNILIDGTVTLASSSDSLQQVLTDWMTYGAADAGNLRTRLVVTDNTSHANTFLAGSGLDWFWATYTHDLTNRKGTDLLN